MNLGIWEPDSIGIMSSYGAKAVSEVTVPPPLQNQHNLYDGLVSIRIKYTIYNYPKLVFWRILTNPSYKPNCSHAASPQGGCHFCSEAKSQRKESEALLCLVSNDTRDQGEPRSDRGQSVDP